MSQRLIAIALIAGVTALEGCSEVGGNVAYSVVVLSGNDTVFQAVVTDRGDPEWVIDTSKRSCLSSEVVDATALDATAGAILFPDNTLAVGHRAAHHVLLFDSLGTFLGTFGRRGAGPGEFADVSWLGVLNGDTAIVYDGGLQRLTAFGSNGQLVGTYNIPSPLADSAAVAGVAGATADGTIIVYAFARPPIREGRHRGREFVYTWRRGEAHLTRIADTPGREVQLESLGRRNLAIMSPLFPRASIVRSRTNRTIWITASDSFRLEGVEQSGGVPRTVTVNYPAASITGGRVDAEITRRERAAGVAYRADAREVLRSRAPGSIPVIAGMEIDGAGNVWLWPRSPGTGKPDDWWIMTPQGRFIGRVANPGTDSIVFIGDRSLVALEVTADGVSVPCVYPMAVSGQDLQ